MGLKKYLKKLAGKVIPNEVKDAVAFVGKAIGEVGDFAGEQVQNAIPKEFLDAIPNELKPYITDLRDLGQAGASIFANYLLPGSSFITAPLSSKGSQKYLNTPLGQVANIAAGLGGSGIGSGTTGVPSASTAGYGWTNALNSAGGAVGLGGLGTDIASGISSITPSWSSLNPFSDSVASWSDLIPSSSSLPEWSSLNPFGSTGEYSDLWSSLNPLGDSSSSWTDWLPSNPFPETTASIKDTLGSLDPFGGSDTAGGLNTSNTATIGSGVDSSLPWSPSYDGGLGVTTSNVGGQGLPSATTDLGGIGGLNTSNTATIGGASGGTNTVGGPGLPSATDTGTGGLSDLLTAKNAVTAAKLAAVAGPLFGGSGAGSGGGAGLGGLELPIHNVAAMQRTQRYVDPNAPFMATGNKSYFTNNNPELQFLAKGGPVYHQGLGSLVQGPGTGTSDSIPAMLSDGEYVLKEKVVSSLGNGSNNSGAKKLDKFQVDVEKASAKRKRFPKSIGLGSLRVKAA